MPARAGAQNDGVLTSVLAISLGASVGAVARWLLGIGLNGLFPALPPGRLAANLMGGYFTGLLQQGRLGWAAATVSAHVVGSLVLTLAGLATVSAAAALQRT